jgi:hypothetical protein
MTNFWDFFLKGLFNWFFFFIFRLQIVGREEKVEKNQKYQQIRGENREIGQFGPRTCAVRRTAQQIYIIIFQH